LQLISLQLISWQLISLQLISLRLIDRWDLGCALLDLRGSIRRAKAAQRASLQARPIDG